MSRGYAEGTEVSAAKSESEIRAMLQKFGADSVITGNEGRKVFVLFKARGRFVKFTLEMVDPAKIAARSPTGQAWNRENRIDAENRRRWRALTLLVKAKLAGIADGIVTFEEEMMAHTVMPDGKPFHEHANPAIEEAYRIGGPPLLRLTGPSS